MNKVILMGRLTRDPNVRYSPRNNSQEEMAIARYTLAVDRRGAKDGQQSADFISCVAFGRDGEFAEKNHRTGSRGSNGLEKDGISGASGENQGSRRRKPARCSFESGNQCKRGIDRI